MIIAPIFGPEAKPPGYQQSAGHDPVATRLIERRHREEAVFEKLSSRFVLHAIEVIDVTGDGRPDILTADNEGVQLIYLQAPMMPGIVDSPG